MFGATQITLSITGTTRVVCCMGICNSNTLDLTRGLIKVGQSIAVLRPGSPLVKILVAK